MFVDFFIHRPVFATVCALLIILSGAVCIPNLPIAMYPTLNPPQVSVACNYVGANADTVEKAVTIPLEEAINGVEGMRYMSSSSTNNGTSMINVTADNRFIHEPPWKLYAARGEKYSRAHKIRVR